MTDLSTQQIGPTPEVVALSHRYGADSAFVLAGGGNTSSKTADTLWVKASGHSLATIGPDGFVALDRRKLDAMLAAPWPADAREREALFLTRVMDARLDPTRGQRPSVEALLHHLLPDPLVVHTHPGLVNAVTCCTDGERLAREWFGDTILWQPYVDPGLVLAKALRDRLAAASTRPAAIFLENHGLIVAGDSAEAVAAISGRVIDRIAAELAARPAVAGGRSNIALLGQAVAALTAHRPGLLAATDASPAAVWLTGTDRGRAAALAGPLSPDQIVYCRSVPLWLSLAGDSATDRLQIANAWAAYESTYGVEPWVALVENAGVVALRNTANMAETTRAVYVDAAQVCQDATRFGGVRTLSPRHRQFIEQWEVEAYRRSVAAGAKA